MGKRIVDEFSSSRGMFPPVNPPGTKPPKARRGGLAGGN